MAPRFCLLALVFLVMAGSGTFFAGPPQLVEASFLGEIGDAKEVFFEQMTCLAEHQTVIDVCHSLTFPFYRLQALLIEGDRRKESCCSRLAASHCMEEVMEKNCGQLGQFFTVFFCANIDKILDKIIEGEQCLDYQIVEQCTDSDIFFLLGFFTCLILFIVVAFVVYVVRTIFKCFCG